MLEPNNIPKAPETLPELLDWAKNILSRAVVDQTLGRGNFSNICDLVIESAFMVGKIQGTRDLGESLKKEREKLIDPEFEKQMVIARECMKRYREAFRELSK